MRFDVEEILSDLRPVPIEPDMDDELRQPAPVDPPSDSRDPVELIVDAARRAPSGGNVQPWRFEADGDEVHFYVEPERSKVSMDVQLRGSYVSIGAALFNARVEAASLKAVGPVKLFPSGSNSTHVATLRLGTANEPELSLMQPAIHTRVANRKMGRPSPIDDTTIIDFMHGVQREGARLRFLTNRDSIEEMAELLGECDRLRFLIPKIHQEMMGELRWPGRDALDEGMDVRTLEMETSSLGIMELLKRPDVMNHLSEWRGGESLGLRTRIMVGSSSAVAVITVPRADPTWYVRGGAAMERFWMAAEQHGLSVQPVAPLFVYATDEQDLITPSVANAISTSCTGSRYGFAGCSTWKTASQRSWCYASFMRPRRVCEASAVH